MKHHCFPKLVFISILFITSIFYIIINIFLLPGSQQQTVLNNYNTLIFNTAASHYNDINRWKKTCQFHTCFEINDCQLLEDDKISVYVYPDHNYMFSDKKTVYQTEPSQEYTELLAIIQSSEYYEPSPSKACVFIPSIDTLNQQRNNLTLVSLMLQALPWWNNGRNHLIFSMLPGQYPTYNSIPDISYGQAMLAGSSLDSTDYRMDYDISIPIYNSLTRTIYTRKELDNDRPYLVTVLTQLGTDSNLIQHFINNDYQSSNERVILLGSCEYCKPCQPQSRCGLYPKDSMWNYPSVLKQSTFCLMLPGYRSDTPDFLDIMMAGCVPVLLRNVQQILPFSEVLDWERGVVWLWKEELTEIMNILRGIPYSVRKEKRLQIQYLYDMYFSSMRSITMTTLHILNGRVFPLAAGSYESWNNRPYDLMANDYFQHSYPLPLDLPPSRHNEGFTAVILTYDRVQMLFQTIASVSQAPNLAMILVVWNNLNLSPPQKSDWPSIAKPLKIIQSKENKLSNRFYPYEEIKTSAVLSLDDDITMLTASEIEFGYRVWLEYPKQIVGYPGRVHWFDANERKWRYESEWTNNVSLVLTGAAFYHKYYHYMYTYKLPSTIRMWADDHFNCEDILFNLMISNYTCLPPIKHLAISAILGINNSGWISKVAGSHIRITPRKRFKCKDCTNDGLFTDVNHFNERNECINTFAAFFNNILPLKTVKFRFDPVLFKVTDIDESLDFPDIGEL